MRRRAGADLEQAAKRSVTDAATRRRMLDDPETRKLFAALTASTADRLPLRFPGLENDVAVTRALECALERIRVPTLVVHGTKDPVVPFTPHARVLAERIPGAALLAVEGGEHACVFTHREFIRTRVARFVAGLDEMSPNAQA